MSLGDLTSPAAVKQALEECIQVGEDVFLKKYKFGASRSYFVDYEGRWYTSKAIVAAAYSIQFPARPPLTASAFSGGKVTVQKKLRSLGFEVVKANMDWRREELVLALDYYLSHRMSQHYATSAGLKELSQLLRSLPFNYERRRYERFRNTHSCEMKLCNFRYLDPSYTGTGLKQGSNLDELIWNEFSGQRSVLAKEAATIKRLLDNQDAIEAVSQPVEDEETFAEGALKLRMHRARERNQALVEKAKKVWLAKDPLLRCRYCGFSFKEKYGVDFIEAHHRKPISELDGPAKAKVKDLMPVCANCHRMLHRQVGLDIVEPNAGV